MDSAPDKEAKRALIVTLRDITGRGGHRNRALHCFFAGTWTGDCVFLVGWLVGWLVGRWVDWSIALGHTGLCYQPNNPVSRQFTYLIFREPANQMISTTNSHWPNPTQTTNPPLRREDLRGGGARAADTAAGGAAGGGGQGRRGLRRDPGGWAGSCAFVRWPGLWGELLTCPTGLHPMNASRQPLHTQ